ncbi:hypothetical protein [Burkholderia anthina]|uniref:hypothetical protein n=1 Tax=Burkholderia anthina TaxID=179879 RepID=UPI0009BF4F4E|nr:hypothetical protein [Burkholderia anthina]
MTRTLSDCRCGAATVTLHGEIVFGTDQFGVRVVPNRLRARAYGGRLPGDLQPSRYGRRAAFPSAFLLVLPLSRPLQDHAFPIAPNNFFLSFRFRFVIIETISGE